MLKAIAAFALGVAAMAAPISVAPAFAEATAERLESVVQLETQPSASLLNNEKIQPQPTEVVQPETVVTVQPSVAPLQPTEAVDDRTVETVETVETNLETQPETLEPSRVEATSLEQVVITEPSQLPTFSNGFGSAYPLVVDLERPLSKPQTTDIPATRTNTKVQPSSQPEPTQVKEIPRAVKRERTIPRKLVNRKPVLPKTAETKTILPAITYTFSNEQIVSTFKVQDLEPSQVADFSFPKARSAAPRTTPQTAQPPQITTEPSQLILEPSRVAPRPNQDITKTKPATKIKPTKIAKANNIVPFARQKVQSRVTRVTPVQVSQFQVSQPRTQTLQKDVSRKASDLGGVIRLSPDAFNPVFPENPAVVQRPISTASQRQTSQTSIAQPKEKPEVTASVGVAVGTETPATLETALGFSYEGYKAQVRVNQPFTGSEATVGIDSTLPLSEKTSLTITANNLNTTPALSAKVEANISDALTTSVTLRDITTKVDVDLATSYQINERTKVGASLTNLASKPQVNVEAAHKISDKLELSAKVDNIVNPSVGLGIAVELTPQMKLEARANDVFGATSYEARITHTFTF